LKTTSKTRLDFIEYFCFYTVDCQWGDWILEECSVSCGGGQQTNNREKLTIELFGGEPCQGEATEVKECNVDECLKCKYLK
jgi:hypothetical protein